MLVGDAEEWNMLPGACMLPPLVSLFLSDLFFPYDSRLLHQGISAHIPQFAHSHT
jgi:hypothetical protein